MSKEIRRSEENREMILAGARRVSDAVRVTLGPRGRNCLVGQENGAPPLVTNDGVTIAKSIEVEDPVENTGAKLIREAASKTNDLAGDGTTTATVLAQGMLEEACRCIAAGASPVELKKGMQMASQLATALIRKMARPVRDRIDVAKIAAISAKDEQIGEMIADALEMAGMEGVVTIEESMQSETTLEFNEGIVFERGYLAKEMITDEEHQTAELYDPYILMTDYKLENPQELVKLLELSYRNGKPLLVIADAVEPAVMGFFLKNKEVNGMNIVAIIPPLYGEGRKWRLEDLAVQTGGTYITKDMGLKLSDLTEDMLGGAEYVKVEYRQTTIIGAKGDPGKIEAHQNMLRTLIEKTDYEFNKNRYKERLAKFVSGVALIKVGADTEVEMKESKLRIDDAYLAARAAIREGICPGGGTTLVDITPPLKKYMETLEGDKKTGVGIVYRALTRPLAQIAENAGFNGSVAVGKVLESVRGTGFDAVHERYTDMISAGIVDPAMAVRIEVQTAVSVVCTLLTTEASVYQSEEV